MKNHNLLLLFITIICFSTTLSAQDIHFSQTHSVSSSINPAMTGLHNGKARIAANYRGQWNNLTNGYKTVAAEADVRAMELKNSIIGGGISMFCDKAGDLDFATTSISLNTSFIQLVGKDTWVSLGFKNTFSQNSLDLTKMKAFDQEDTYSSRNSGYWDLSTGLALMHQIDKKNLVHIGASIAHINGANISFFDTKNLKGKPSDAINTIARKLVLHGGADIQLGKDFHIRPNFIFMDQGPHREITIGSFVKYDQSIRIGDSNKDAAIYVGAWLRWFTEADLSGSDAFIGAVRMDYDDMFFTLSYDVNISSLLPASDGQGGTELSVVKMISKDKVKRQKLKCPANYL